MGESGWDQEYIAEVERWNKRELIMFNFHAGWANVTIAPWLMGRDIIYGKMR